MKRERRRGDPGAPQAEPDEEPPEEQRRSGVEEDVYEVIPERAKAPEALLDPVGREDERVVLLVRPRLGPDPREPRGSVEGRVLGDVGVALLSSGRTTPGK